MNLLKHSNTIWHLSWYKYSANGSNHMNIELQMNSSDFRWLLDPVCGQDIRQARQVGGIWVTVPRFASIQADLVWYAVPGDPAPCLFFRHCEGESLPEGFLQPGQHLPCLVAVGKEGFKHSSLKWFSWRRVTLPLDTIKNDVSGLDSSVFLVTRHADADSRGAHFALDASWCLMANFAVDMCSVQALWAHGDSTLSFGHRLLTLSTNTDGLWGSETWPRFPRGVLDLSLSLL